MSSHSAVSSRLLAITLDEFRARFGVPDLGGALCGYTREADTAAVLTLLCHARPARILEVGTALGHMTANLTRWSPEDAQVFTIDLVRGMPRAAAGAAEQLAEVPALAERGRFADHFGAVHKAFFITADSLGYDFGRLAPLDFAFIDGGHDFAHATADSRKAYDALAPGGWLVWHDFGSPVPWVEVRQAVEAIGFDEPVIHIEGTEVAFLRKQAAGGVTGPAPVHEGPVRVAWDGEFRGLHSLGLVNRAICSELLARGHDLSLADDGPPTAEEGTSAPLHPGLAERLGHEPSGGPAQVHVMHRWPPRSDFEPQARRVLMQPWEYGSLPRAWLPLLAAADEVWAYSRSVRDAYLRAGMPHGRVHVIPLGVDPEAFRPGVEPLPLPPGPRFRFLFVGGTIFRKGIDVLLDAFPRAFGPEDGVGLVIKDMGVGTFYRGQTAGDKVAALRERGYPVEYLTRDLAGPELAGLYAACDCLVHPFRGEGFALPVAEAMACGLPVIATAAGPVTDYADDATAYLIPARRCEFSENRVGEFETIARPWLHEPDRDALVDLLRRVAADPQAARRKGAAASERIRGRFTWSHTAEAVERRLRALASLEPRTGRRFKPRMNTDKHRWGEGFRDGGTGGGWQVGRAGGPGAAPGGRQAGGVSGSPNPVSVSYPCESVSICGSKSPGPIRGAAKAKVSLTMIVRDEEENLPRCLGSVAGLFDEVIVVDTGSRDRTVEIARGFGARVFDFAWVDDFAAARNAALARARGDYAFWLDADDVVEPDERAKLERLLASLPAEESEQAAYVVRCACDPEPDGRGGNTVVDHIRLFPAREGVRWTYAVHEQILPALRRAVVPVRWSDVTVRHTGYSDPALRGRKLERDARILEAELAERPGDPFVLFNLGSIAVERQDWPRALELLQRSLSGSAPSDSITRKLFALIARCRQMLGDLPRAIAACDEGLSFFPDDAELLFRKAVAHRGSGDPRAAEASWRRILGLRRPEEFASVDQGIYGHLTRRNLAALAEERGDLAGAMEHWQAVLEECPGDAEAMVRVGGLVEAGGP
ncbi:SPBc2 prophage-derived glycosyltransferase SunS [Aquisphaera giovannonii]|uniref:SPBc2 prophage-derived glycosyltransferase SunS n=1 Tax=Aquisphaera giovannonii TaxID=406548 RepID=A0A5B9WCS3_9BACT|nr:glycosyltransferase [Aquisphaera giovannonii]QEH37741.1 SPBc2 prophage-derived glycosyltransferase SunS [Aquisphaera giovannonii]